MTRLAMAAISLVIVAPVASTATATSRTVPDPPSATATTTTNDTTADSLTPTQQDQVDACVTFVPIGAFVGTQQYVDLWTFSGLDEAQLQLICESFVTADPRLLSSIAADAAAYENETNPTTTAASTTTSTTAAPTTTDAATTTTIAADDDGPSNVGKLVGAIIVGVVGIGLLVFVAIRRRTPLKPKKPRPY